MNHPLKRPPHATPKWPSYTGTSHYVGTSTSGRVAVYVDPTLGTPGQQNAADLVADADRVVNANDTIFGSTGGKVSVIIFAIGGQTDGTGGADHLACNYKSGNAIEVCASFGNSVRVSALFEAELSECSMGGNLCGVSTGEAPSRSCMRASPEIHKQTRGRSFMLPQSLCPESSTTIRSARVPCELKLCQNPLLRRARPGGVPRLAVADRHGRLTCLSTEAGTCNAAPLPTQTTPRSRHATVVTKS